MSFSAGKGALKLKGDDSIKKKKRKKKGKELALVDDSESQPTQKVWFTALVPILLSSNQNLSPCHLNMPLSVSC